MNRSPIKTLPYAFTEHGALMVAGILNTPRAIEMSLFVVRAFVKLREVLSAHKELSHKLDELERNVGKHDEAIKAIILTIRKLMEQKQKRKQGGSVSKEIRKSDIEAEYLDAMRRFQKFEGLIPAAIHGRTVNFKDD